MIDQLYIMGLDRRKELWLELEQECFSRNFPTRVFIVGDGKNPALTYNHIDPINVDGRWNWGQGESARRHYYAFLSHRAIIKDAIENNYNSIMLLEDDAYFTSRWNDQFFNICLQIPLVNPDIIYLGWHAYEYNNHLFSGRNIEIEEQYKKDNLCYLKTIHKCGGLFGVILYKSIFPLIMNMAPVGPIDHQLNFYRSKIRSYNTVPSLIYVRSCFSECEQQFIKRDNL